MQFAYLVGRLLALRPHDFMCDMLVIRDLHVARVIC